MNSKPVSPSSILRDLLAEIEGHDKKLDDEANGGANARPPTGDDYNDVLGHVISARARLAVFEGEASTKVLFRREIPGEGRFVIWTEADHAWAIDQGLFVTLDEGAIVPDDDGDLTTGDEAHFRMRALASAGIERAVRAMLLDSLAAAHVWLNRLPETSEPRS